MKISTEKEVEILSNKNSLSKEDYIKFREIVDDWKNLEGYTSIGSDHVYEYTIYDHEICRNQESVDSLVGELLCNYKNMLTSLRVESRTEKEQTDENDKFCFELSIGQIISVHDEDYVESMMDDVNEENIQYLEKYIKNSKTSGLIHIDDFVFDYYTGEKSYGAFEGIYEYDMLIESLKKSGLNLSIYILDDDTIISNPSYDDLLNCIIGRKSIKITMVDKNCVYDGNGFYNLKQSKKSKQEVVKEKNESNKTTEKTDYLKDVVISREDLEIFEKVYGHSSLLDKYDESKISDKKKTNKKLSAAELDEIKISDDEEFDLDVMLPSEFSMIENAKRYRDEYDFNGPDSDLVETSKHVYIKQEDVDSYVSRIYDACSVILKGSKTVGTAVEKLYKKENKYFDSYEKDEISECNKYCFKLSLGAVVSANDIDYSISMMEDATEESIQHLKNYIKNSKTNGLIKVEDISIDYCIDEKTIKHFLGICDYEMFIKALEKFNLNISLKILSNNTFIINPTYDYVLDCVIRQVPCEIILSDKRYTYDEDGYYKLRQSKRNYQKVFK